MGFSAGQSLYSAKTVESNLCKSVFTKTSLKGSVWEEISKLRITELSAFFGGVLSVSFCLL